VQFLCNEWKRHQHRHPGISGPDDPTPELPDPAPEPTEGLRTSELIAMVRQCVRELPTPRDRWILTEYFVKDRDKESICREGGLDPVHFNRVLHRAKSRLGELMLKAGHDPADYLSLLIFAFAAGLAQLP
jgi:DNA-directed RNA polymerase specialized sigma24 family protein